jgi:uncharacterized protein YcbX
MEKGERKCGRREDLFVSLATCDIPRRDPALVVVLFLFLFLFLFLHKQSIMSTKTAVTIKELWVYPVKACQGVQVSAANVTPTGLEYDRTWCVVDLEGTHVPKLEAISGRRMPVLATITVSFANDMSMLSLAAPGMPQLQIPTTEDSYKDCETVTVESAGAAGSGTWSLAFLECQVHAQGSAWINDYLNKPHAKYGLVNGKKIPGRFALLRSCTQVVHLKDYPPIFPLIAKAQSDVGNYQARFAGNYRRLSDFAPFLLVSEASAQFLGSACDLKEEYPTTSFRGNIIVTGESLAPWAEESWAELEISSANDKDKTPLVLHTIKACPRCTVPCRDQAGTGGWLFPTQPLTLWNVLKKLYPRKFSDPEWGSWAGAFMGVYMGHHGQTGKIAVGDRIHPTKRVAWDAHLKSAERERWIKMGGVIAAVSLIPMVRILWKRRYS